MKDSSKIELKITYGTYHQIVMFSEFFGNVRKLSTKNTTKLENSSNRYSFHYRNDLVVGKIGRKKID